MGCPGDLVYNAVSSQIFGVLPFNLDIVENHIFSDVRICAALDVHNVPIYQVPSLIL